MTLEHGDHYSIKIAELILILMLSANIFALQARIYGVVKDDEGEPIEKAKISIVNSQFGNQPIIKITKKDGKFLFGNLATGEWEIAVSAEGYDGVKQAVRVGHGQVIKVDFTLKKIGIAAVTKVKDTAFNLGITYFDKKEYQKAIEAFLSFAEKHAEMYQVNLNIAACYEQLSQYEKAIKYYLFFLEKEPKSVVALNGLAYSYYYNNDYEKAAEVAQKIVVIEPDKADNYYLLGEIYFSSEQIEEALESYHKVIEIDGSYADSYKKIGFVHLKKQQYQEAIPYFEKYLELKPQSPDAEEIKKVLSQIKQK